LREDWIGLHIYERFPEHGLALWRFTLGEPLATRNLVRTIRIYPHQFVEHGEAIVCYPTER
jgi:hypothetical protein